MLELEGELDLEEGRKASFSRDPSSMSSGWAISYGQNQ